MYVRYGVGRAPGSFEVPSSSAATRLGLSYGTAARWAEIALALESLPKLAAAFESGAISLDKLSAGVRFATPETDAFLAEEAKTSSATGLESEGERVPVRVGAAWGIPRSSGAQLS